MIKNPIILVDGSFYIHKAYYAFPPLTTSQGTPIWVVYGVIHMLKSLLIRYQPIHIVVVFDASGKTFRDDLFKQYKANRIKMPQNLYNQLNLLHEIIYAMDIPILQIPYVEADDVIATLAISYAQSGKTVLIGTGDKDMAQIVSSKINLIDITSKNVLNSEEVEKKFGVPPILIADYLALIGDRSDNIPGIPGIGKKIAPILLKNIGKLPVLYKNLQDIHKLKIRSCKKVLHALIANEETALLSYQLATIKTDVLLRKKDYMLSIPKINFEKLIVLFKKCEFNNWLMELRSGIWLKNYELFNTESVIQKENYMRSNQIRKKPENSCQLKKSLDCSVMYTIEEINKWIKEICVTDFLILNIHADTDNISTAKVISICLSICNNHIKNKIYIPIVEEKSNLYNKSYFYIKDVLLLLKPILENSKIKKIGQNIKFHYALLKRYDVNLVGVAFDVLLEWYILYGSVNYKYIKRFLDQNIFDAISIFKKTYENYYNHYNILKSRDIESELLFSSELINAIFNLHQILWLKIKENNQLKQVFKDVEIPLISVLSKIEGYGVLIDKNLLSDHEIALSSRLHNLTMQAYKLVHASFNLDSTKQLQEILYDKQKLPILKKTPTGAPSTSEEVLKRLSKKYLIAKVLLKYRSLSKLKSTYTNKLISMIHQKSNRIHTSYNQIRTSTGRLSSANPNLQNIPNRNYDGRKIRQAFIAPPSFVIVSADYSQIELRIMAHLSHDLKLIRDFISGKDIHTTTASEIFVTAVHLVTDEQRHQAKTINFGLIYGMTAFGLARQLSVTCKEAQQYVDRYFQRYPGIMQYMQYIKNNANTYGYVSTLNGRKLYLPDIYSTNISQKKSAERSAINAPMQGTAADIIKKAMISIDCWLKEDKIPVRMIMQVHDELVFEVQNNFIEIAVKKIKKLMEESFILDVPLKVDIGVGKNWEQAH